MFNYAAINQAWSIVERLPSHRACTNADFCLRITDKSQEHDWCTACEHRKSVQLYDWRDSCLTGASGECAGIPSSRNIGHFPRLCPFFHMPPETGFIKNR